jgi:pyruvate dehydrogenase E1 component alpha subunit
MGPAVGAALSRKLQGKEGVAVSYIGEGAANQGAFHEALNLAALWKLPVIFVIEDNAWGISVAKSTSTAIPNNAMRAQGYGMPGHLVRGNDPIAIFSAAGEAIELARNGGGPSLLDIETDRLAGHFMGDAEAYRPKGELEALRARDPIPALARLLQAEDGLTDADNLLIVSKAREKVDEAIRFARDSEYPEPEEALEKVFA